MVPEIGSEAWFSQDSNLRLLDSESRVMPVEPCDPTFPELQALLFLFKKPSANVCWPFGWSAVSACCLLAARLFGGSVGGGGGGGGSVHRIAIRSHKPSPHPPSQTGARCRRGDITLCTVYENTHTPACGLQTTLSQNTTTCPQSLPGGCWGVWWMLALVWQQGER